MNVFFLSFLMVLIACAFFGLGYAQCESDFDRNLKELKKSSGGECWACGEKGCPDCQKGEFLKPTIELLSLLSYRAMQGNNPFQADVKKEIERLKSLI